MMQAGSNNLGTLLGWFLCWDRMGTTGIFPTSVGLAPAGVALSVPEPEKKNQAHGPKKGLKQWVHNPTEGSW